MPQKAPTLHQFHITMSNYNYRTLSRSDTQLDNHHTMYMNSLKDHQSKTDFFFQNICSYKIICLCLIKDNAAYVEDCLETYH